MIFLKSSSVLCFVALLTLTLIYLLSQSFSILLLYVSYNQQSNRNHNWIVRLLINLLGYATIFLPGIIFYVYVKKSKLAEKQDRSCFSYLLRECFVGVEKKNFTSLEPSGNATVRQSFLRDALKLLFCSSGLLLVYLIWGLLQERIMTQVYTNTDGESGKFQDSQFLVFVNRILAFLLSGIAIFILHQPRRTVPLYKFIYCSFSNIMSSWCQYEALKYINFPTQVLSKACKLIAVMIMGKIVSKRKYEYYEYITAVMICIGMVLFSEGSADVSADDQTVTTFSGTILIIGYMVFDSFTSNWQSELFAQYSVSTLQMMCGINFFSCLLTSVSLLQQRSFFVSFEFSFKFPSFAFDCFLLSFCSALGQLFVFHTISCFGPIVFVIIMTFRQALAIILSCITYHHSISIIGIIGIMTVFCATFLRIYSNYRMKMIRKKPPNTPSAV